MRNLVFNKTILTDETIQKTRQWFHDNDLACIEEVKNGSVKIEDEETYFKWRNETALESLAGKHDNTFTFLQRAYYIQTGESVALFPS